MMQNDKFLFLQDFLSQVGMVYPSRSIADSKTGPSFWLNLPVSHINGLIRHVVNW